MSNATLSYDTIVVGGGQAGLATGYYLKQQRRNFIILDASARVGDAWRNRWESLRLFTPARYDGLPGMPFPAPPHAFPTKNEMADYLEAYAARFELPVRTGIRVDRLSKQGDRFVVTSGDQRFEAKNIVVAMGNYQEPHVPAFAQELSPSIVQFHSSQYRSPSQLQDGGVLVVGVGNSGAEIALETVWSHQTWLSGRETGHIPFRIEGLASQLFLSRLVIRFNFHYLLTMRTPIGRTLRPRFLTRAAPLIRTKPKDLVRAGVERVPRVIGVRNGIPMLEDNRVLDVKNVIWCTGFDPGFSWIDLPVLGELEPMHERGIVSNEPGLYFVGLHFLYAMSSGMIQGVGRDASYIAKNINARAATSTTPAAAQSLTSR